MTKLLWETLLFVNLMLASIQAIAAPIFYADRNQFLSAVSSLLTDDYSGYVSIPGTPELLTDPEMTAVFGESRY